MKQKISILLVDDDDDILEFLQYNFESKGYIVTTANNGKTAIEEAVKRKPDLIILDIMMPGIDGIEVCERIKEIGKANNSLIMFLSARGEDYTQIAGFDAGADDFVTKPINPKVLIKRVEALIRRKIYDDVSIENSNVKNIEIGNLLINQKLFSVSFNNNEIVLPKKEFKLLLLLAGDVSRVYTRDEIFDKIWGDTFVGERTIDVHIRKLREKLGADSIKTIKGVGYKLNVTHFI